MTGTILENMKNSYKRYGALYPVIVSEDGEIIDGYHRKKIDPNWPEIRVQVDPLKKEILAFVANINRREIRGTEISQRLARIKSMTGWTAKRIARELGRSEEWVLKYLPQKYKDPVKRKAGKRGGRPALRRKPNSSKKAQNPENSEKLTLTEKRDEISNQLFVENVWRYNGRENGFGDANFHGNTDPRLVKECLLKYAPPKGTVLDPMAGSGTVLDVCNHLKLKNISYDVRPLRREIKLGDAASLPLRANSVDFIFAHFPYWKKVAYSDNKDDMSSLTWKEFLSKCERVFEEMHRILKPNRYVAVLIGDHRHNGRLFDIAAHVSIIGQKHFVLHDKIVYLTHHQRSQKGIEKNVALWRARKGKHHLICADYLLIFKKV